MDNRFIKLPLTVLSDARLSRRDLRVLLALYSFGSEPGDVVWPSRDVLCKLTRLPPNHVSASITHLEEFGWILRKQMGPRANHITLLCPTVTDSVTVTESVSVTDSGKRSDRFGTKDVTDSVRHITDQEQTKEQTNNVTARARRTENKQPAGASSGGEGPHQGDSAKPNSRAKPKRRITDDWQPSERCLSVLEQGGIPRTFALSLVGEFRIFWIDDGTARASWDATFINRAKLLWRPPSTRHAKNQRPDNTVTGKIAAAIQRRDAAFGQSDASSNVIELRSSDYRAVAY